MTVACKNFLLKEAQQPQRQDALPLRFPLVLGGKEFGTGVAQAEKQYPASSWPRRSADSRVRIQGFITLTT